MREGSDCKTATHLNASEVVSQQRGTLVDGVRAQLVEGAQLLEGDLADVLEDDPDDVLGAGRRRERSAIPKISAVKLPQPVPTSIKLGFVRHL